MAHLDIMLLGRFEARLNDERIDQFSYDKVRALLAYLAVESDRLHPRESIAGLLWADYPEQRARQNLSQALLTLRKAINDDAADPPFLHITRYALQLNGDCDHSVDVSSFLSLLRACDAHNHGELANCEACLDRLRRATELYRGDFLATFSLPDSPGFEEWALLERERLSRKAVVALDALATSYLARGEYANALEHARRHVLLDPWQEGAHRQVMQALALMGQRHAAVEQYERCRTALEADLGVAPEPETTALYEQIRTGSLTPAPGQGASASPGPGSPRDDKPTTVSCEPIDDAARPRQREGPPAHNLPAQLAPFIGRQAELEALSSLFCGTGNRLIGLIGPGGSGKTSLAIEAARRCLNRFADGIYLVSLVALRSREAVAPTIAETIGLQLRAGDDPVTRLADYLRGRSVLLILDSFEHVVHALDIVLHLLNEAPALHVVLTSRIRTHAQSEVMFVVEGLDVPDAETELDPDQPGDALALFAAGARRNQPSFTLTTSNIEDVRRICGWVDGLPLAVLLAASWVPLLSPNEIADRLGREYADGADFLRAEWQDVPLRQRSLRAVFDHAWRLLTIREKAVFEALSVFRGGFTQAAAREVAGATLWELRGLVSKSFVNTHREGRYEIHELMRQYAHEKLEATPIARDEVRSQHSTYYLSKMTGWATALKAADQQSGLEELTLEIENARLAWSWLLENHDLGELCPGLDACCLFYDWRVRYEEGRSLCRLTLDMTATDGLTTIADTGPSRYRDAGIQLRARAMTWLGHFEHLLGHKVAAESWLMQALELVASIPDPPPRLVATHGFVLEQLGLIAAVHDRDAALDLYREALRHYQEARDEWGVANAYFNLGGIGHQTSRYGQATQWYRESLTRRRKLGDPRGIADALVGLGFTAIRKGDVEDGVRLIREGGRLRRSVGDRTGTALATFQLGQALMWAGRLIQSRGLLAESIALFEGLGSRYHYAYANVFLGCVTGAMGDYDRAQEQLIRGTELTESGGYRRENAFAHLCLGGVALAQDRLDDALALMESAAAAYRELDQRDDLSWAIGALAVTLRAMGRETEAWPKLESSLMNSMGLKSLGTILWGLPAAALLLCDSGEVLKAWEIYGLLRRYPMVANAAWYDDILGSCLRGAAAEASPELTKEAEERGRHRAPEELATEVMGMVKAKIAEQESQLAEIGHRAYAQGDAQSTEPGGSRYDKGDAQV